MLLSFSVYLGGLLNTSLRAPPPSGSGSVGLEEGAIIYIFHKFLGDTNASSSEATLGVRALTGCFPGDSPGLTCFSTSPWQSDSSSKGLPLSCSGSRSGCQ